MIHVTTANVTDRAGALEGFALYKRNLINVVNVLVDGGYTGEPFAADVKDILGATVAFAFLVLYTQKIVKQVLSTP